MKMLSQVGMLPSTAWCLLLEITDSHSALELSEGTGLWVGTLQSQSGLGFGTWHCSRGGSHTEDEGQDKKSSQQSLL